MKPTKALALVAFLSLTSFGVSAAVGDEITDSKKLKYNVLTEPSDGQPGTCEVGNNQDYTLNSYITIPYSVVEDRKSVV